MYKSAARMNTSHTLLNNLRDWHVCVLL